VSLLKGFLWGGAKQNAEGAKQESPRPQKGVESIHTSHACKGKTADYHG